MTKKGINKEIWLEFVWPGYHWYQGINPMYAYLEDIPKLGYNFSKMAVTYSKGTESFYFIRDEYENNGLNFFKAVKNTPKILFNVLEKINDVAEQIFELGDKWQDVDFSKLTDRQLIIYHKELFRWDKLLWRLGQIPNLLELHNSYLSDYVKVIIGNKFGPNRISEIFGTLTTSAYDSVSERHDRDFLTLIQKRNDKNIKLMVKDQWRKYTWMIYGWAGPALNLDYFSQNLQEASLNGEIAKKIEDYIESKKIILVKQNDFLEKFSLSDRQLVVLLRTILEEKARRVDAHSLTYYIAEKMMIEIGRRVGLNLEQMRMIPPDEVANLYKKVDAEKINNEYDRVLFWHEKTKLEKLTGQKAEEKIQYIIEKLPKVEVTNELRGSLAYKGKVQGKVKMVLDIKDGKQFQPGEILVTRMTDPSYVPIMKIAGAIVTDVGGITCHAAIVSRELGIPCIVGTKIATKVLKDGDLVEVDAVSGVVRIIKKV